MAAVGFAAWPDGGASRSLSVSVRLSDTGLGWRHAARIWSFRNIRMAAGPTEPVPRSHWHGHHCGISPASRHRWIWRSESLEVAGGGTWIDCHRLLQYDQISTKPDLPADDSGTGGHALWHRGQNHR